MPRMGLHDHFRPPLGGHRHWHSFHNGWAFTIAARLNALLPPNHFAEGNVQFGVEIDVAAFEAGSANPAGDVEVGTVVDHRASAATWSPPLATLSVPFPLVPDSVEVLVYRAEGGATLVGAIELVSPANKDRGSHRQAFLSKCEAYLQQGVGLVVVDVVTERAANLHRELLSRLAPDALTMLAADLYAAAYRVVERDGHPTLDVWEEALALGAKLPTLPLWLAGEVCLPIELDATYDRVCHESRIGSGA
jgi:hypothetical protein